MVRDMDMVSGHHDSMTIVTKEGAKPGEAVKATAAHPRSPGVSDGASDVTAVLGNGEECTLKEFSIDDVVIGVKAVNQASLESMASAQYRSLKAACSRARLGRLLLFRAAHVSKRSLGLVGAP